MRHLLLFQAINEDSNRTNVVVISLQDREFYKPDDKVQRQHIDTHTQMHTSTRKKIDR